MDNRRSFLAGVVGASLVTAGFREDALARAARAGDDAGKCPADELAGDEDYWSEIQRCFDTDRTLINLNNGGVCPTPEPRPRADDPRPPVHQRVAGAAHVADPRAPRRVGAPRPRPRVRLRRRGDRDHPQRVRGDGDPDLRHRPEARRRGDHHRPELPADDHELGAARPPRGDRRQEDLLPDPAAVDPQDFVDRVREAITPRTRVIEFPHITNLSGQILPVRDVVRLGKEKGIEVFIDGAHAFAHFPFKRDDLECDYFGCSLHKWLLAPIGTGFLYVRKSKQKTIWPLMGADAPLDEDIRKYEQIGTHPAANHNAISAALAFHRSIGADRKIARLRYLRDRWAKPLLAADKRVKVWTPLGDGRPFGRRSAWSRSRGSTPASSRPPLGEAPDRHHADPAPQFERRPRHAQRLHHARRDRRLRRCHEESAGQGRLSRHGPGGPRLLRGGCRLPAHRAPEVSCYRPLAASPP